MTPGDDTARTRTDEDVLADAGLRADMLPEVFLAPVGVNAYEATVSRLATSIRLGVYVDGEVLPSERELAERLAVSRNTVRDAMSALREAGLIATRRGRGGGSVVTRTGSADVLASMVTTEAAPAAEVLDFRRVVEPGAAWLAAQRTLSSQERAWLVAAEREVTEASSEHHRVADSRLHLAIATVSGSRLVVDSVTRAQSALDTLLRQIPVLRPNIEHSHQQHEAVVRAVLAGDADGARGAMEEHVDGTALLLRGLIG